MNIIGAFMSLFGIAATGTKEVLTPKYTSDQTYEHIADLHGLKGEQRARYLKEMGHTQYKHK